MTALEGAFDVELHGGWDADLDASRERERAEKKGDKRDREAAEINCKRMQEWFFNT